MRVREWVSCHHWVIRLRRGRGRATRDEGGFIRTCTMTMHENVCAMYRYGDLSMVIA